MRIDEIWGWMYRKAGRERKEMKTREFGFSLSDIDMEGRTTAL